MPTPYRTLATVSHHGMITADLQFEVPLDHAQPDGEKLPIFARSVIDADKPDSTSPWLVFLQGGPGFPGPRPFTRSGWVKRALQDYRVLLLDSRGNGGSAVVLPQTLARRGDARAQARYLSHFRADRIVDDCELIRRQLAGPDVDVERSRPELWRVLRSPLPVGASRRLARSIHHRRAAASGVQHGRLLSRDLPGGAQQDAEAFRPLSRRRSARRADPATPPRPRGDAADRREAHGPPFPAAGIPAGIRRRHGDASLPARIGLLRGSERARS